MLQPFPHYEKITHRATLPVFRQLFQRECWETERRTDTVVNAAPLLWRVGKCALIGPAFFKTFRTGISIQHPISSMNFLVQNPSFGAMLTPTVATRPNARHHAGVILLADRWFSPQTSGLVGFLKKTDWYIFVRGESFVRGGVSTPCVETMKNAALKGPTKVRCA